MSLHSSPHWAFKYRLLLLPLSALVASACFCQFDPFASEYTRTRPQASDVVGTYVLTRQTLTGTPLDQLTAADGAHATAYAITLDDDGSFEVVNFPAWVDGWVNGSQEKWSISRFVSGTGTWTIRVNGSVNDGSGVLQNTWGIELSGLGNQFGPITVAGEKPPYTLVFGYGDPDAGDAMFYESDNAANAK